ncbi:MAG: alpha/beta hydrolase [Anaerolineales bacterium]|nr:alpha/beta hydrolase [Anaerolineales bacterium]
MKSRGQRYWRNLIVFFLGVLLIVLGFIFYVVLPIQYAQGVAHPKRAPVCCITPAEWGLAYEDVSFMTEDGITLKGWYIPSGNEAAVILSHGIGGNRLSMLEQGAFLAENDFGVLLVDLRAHGESGGDRVSFGGADIIAALDYLQTRDDVDPGRIGALGVSLGALVTIQAAAVRPDIKAAAADGTAANSFRDLPRPPTFVHLLDWPFQAATFLVWDGMGVAGPMPVTQAAAELSPRPLLLIAGIRSQYEQALNQKLYAAAGEPKTLWEVPEAGHAGAWRADPEEYKQRILSLFEQALLEEE